VITRLLPGTGVDRPRILVLTAGHVGADVFQGAVPALVPFFVADRGWSYAAAGALVLIASLGSSLLQPLAGLVGDRVRAPWVAPAGLLLVALGLVAAALTEDYVVVAAALGVGGLGVAAFHPEAVRAAVDAAGTSPGAALGFFATGGNAGFALGPALVAPLALGLGLAGVSLVAVIPLVGALLLVRVGRRTSHHAGAARSVPEGAREDWPLFGLAAGAAIVRTGFMFGLMAYVPAWFGEDLDSSVALGSAAIATMLVTGAAGTYLGGRLGDVHGRHRVIVLSLAATLPLAALLPLCGPLLAVPLLVVLGVAMEMNFYPLVLVAQEALPRRVGFASGVTIGLSVGVGAGCAALLGLIADSSGLTTALWVCSALSGLALLLALGAAARARSAAALEPVTA
jgi:FSR family fosmidomycin resistance protein-like MFS transporter